MANALMNAYMALIPQIDAGAKKDIENDVADAGEKGSSRFGKALSAAGKVAVAGIAAGIAGLGKVAADAFSAFADFEQLTGGIDTLFGEGSQAAEMVKQQAQEAYRTAGLSANAYLETVTGFSAALLQSLGGDAEEAARIADMAIRDMSDNANKMGTDMASIQVAYQGFAKDNYTMLDNLKLGYGGTREEMLRLIDDANAMREAQGLAGDLTIESYADVVEAIHTVQDNMHITGATAAESASTIQGSLSSVKASWANLLVGLADDESALGGLVETFLSNVVTFAQKALPRLTIIVDSIGAMLPTMIDMVIQFLGTDILPLFESLINTIIAHIPDFIQAGVRLLVSIVQDLPTIVSNIIAVIPDVIGALVDTLLDPNNIMLFLNAGVQLMMGMAQGILDAIPKLLKKAIQGLKGLVDGILGWLGIKSPSRMFAEIGDYCMQGLGVGFDEGTDEAVRAAQSAVAEVTDAAQAQVEIGALGGLTTGAAGNSPIIIQSVNIQADHTTTADEIFGRIRMAAAMA